MRANKGISGLIINKILKWLDVIENKIRNMNNNVSDIYDNSSTYKVGDYCIYNNTLYKCIEDIHLSEEWTEYHWKRVSITEEIHNSNNNIDIIISDTEPESNSILWVNTTGEIPIDYGDTLLLKLDNVDETDQYIITINDEQYSVENIGVTGGSPSEDDVYVFKIN